MSGLLTIWNRLKGHYQNGKYQSLASHLRNMGLGKDADEIEEAIIEGERLQAQRNELLAVLEEVASCAEYWSEYDVPVGLSDRIKAAIAKAKGRA